MADLALCLGPKDPAEIGSSNKSVGISVAQTQAAPTTIALSSEAFPVLLSDHGFIRLGRFLMCSKRNHSEGRDPSFQLIQRSPSDCPAPHKSLLLTTTLSGLLDEL